MYGLNDCVSCFSIMVVVVVTFVTPAQYWSSLNSSYIFPESVWPEYGIASQLYDPFGNVYVPGATIVETTLGKSIVTLKNATP